MSRIQFGTDGWRAVIAEDFTFANLDRVAQATASFWKQNSVAGTEPLVVIGYDRRFLSNEFADRTAAIMAANGFQVVLTSKPTPTPAISFMVKTARATGGVMITASHNPAIFNGFKLKAYHGGSADQTICRGVEALLNKVPVQEPDAKNNSQIRRVDVFPAYFKALKKLVDFPLIAKSKLRFAHEALYGVGAGCFDTMLKGTKCKVTTLHAKHDPFFGGISPEPIAKNYVESSAFLKKHPHDLCLVTDGDADRIGGMDGRGNPISTHQIICLLLRHFILNRKGQGRVVKALTTTSMVDKICAEYGLDLAVTGVGFKYICAEMVKGGVLLGFEESGGIAFPEHVPDRDGILAGLMLLELLAVEKQPLPKLLAQLEKRYGPHRYARADTQFPLEKRAALMAYCAKHPPGRLLKSEVCAVQTFDGVKYVARDGTWLMLRGSGTEPILRIYAETRTDEGAQQLIRDGVAMTRRV